MPFFFFQSIETGQASVVDHAPLRIDDPGVDINI